jgi:hypothetical protein
MSARSAKTRASGRSHTRTGRRWSHRVKTVSTHPRAQLFTMDAPTIARDMARKSVSPKGIGSGIRMIQFFINRAGKSLSPSRRRVLERAKRVLQARRRQEQTATR